MRSDGASRLRLSDGREGDYVELEAGFSPMVNFGCVSSALRALWRHSSMAFLQIAVWSSSYVVSISCNKLIQKPLAASTDSFESYGLAKSTNLFLTVTESGMIGGILRFDTGLQLVLMWVTIVPVFLVYLSFGTWLLGNQTLYSNLTWKDDGEDLPSFSVQLRVKLVNVFIGSMNYVSANYLCLVLFSTLFYIHQPQCTEYVSKSSPECLVMDDSILWVTIGFSVVVCILCTFLLICTEDFVAWWTVVLTRGGMWIQRRGILSQHDLSQQKFAPIFSGMFFGCWAWFAGVAFYLSVQMTLTRPYLDMWSSGLARTVVLVSMLLVFFSVLASYRYCMAHTEPDTEGVKSQWVDRLVEAGQKLGYKGWVWACALHIYYLVKQRFPIVNRMLKQQPEELGEILLLALGHTAVHFMVQVVLEMSKQHFKAQSKTQSVLRIEPLEIIEVFFTINVYSNALVWLAFAWDVALVHGALPSDIGDYYIFWLVIVFVLTAIHLAFAIWAEQYAMPTRKLEGDETNAPAPRDETELLHECIASLALDDIDIRLSKPAVRSLGGMQPRRTTI